MIIGYARVSTSEQNFSLQHDDLKPAFDATVDPTRPHDVSSLPAIRPRHPATFDGLSG